MEKKIIINNQEIKYKLRKSKRARRMRLAVYCDASVVVTIPRGFGEWVAERFIKKQADWLAGKINHFKKNRIAPFSENGKQDYAKYKKTALALAEKRVGYFNKVYNFRFNKIVIRNQKTRWGSCSKKGNLSFNYKLALLPKKFSDYIVVHELCHLEEFNHSRRFWDLVEKTIPDYKNIIREIKG